MNLFLVIYFSLWNILGFNNSFEDLLLERLEGCPLLVSDVFLAVIPLYCLLFPELFTVRNFLRINR